MSLESNIKLAEFMGMTKKYSYLHGGVVYVSGFSTYNDDELNYHNSFDWIMPVAQEIVYKYPEISVDFDKEFKKNPYDKKHIYNCCCRFIDDIKVFVVS